jgi:hypothetical protein
MFSTSRFGAGAASYKFPAFPWDRRLQYAQATITGITFHDVQRPPPSVTPTRTPKQLSSQSCSAPKLDGVLLDHRFDRDQVVAVAAKSTRVDETDPRFCVQIGRRIILFFAHG